MKTPQLLVLLLAIMVHGASAFPSDRKQGREKHASWDDVNVVAHGLLQLGQGLKEHVDKTKAQMRDVSGKLKAFNGTMAELQRRQQEQGRALEARGEEMEERAKAAARLAEEAKEKVEEVKKDNDDIHSRMGRLEEKVEEVLAEPALDGNDSDHSGGLLLQKLLAAQNRRIDHLVEKIKQQQDKLEKQNLHLQALQSKVAQRRVKSHRRRDEETAALRGEPEQSAAAGALARDCHDLFLQGQRANGIYAIQPEASEPFNVLCEMTPEGGWTVVQKRQDGSQNFNRQWESYKKGFGSLNGDFWLGLDSIHSITKQGGYVLHVQLSDQAGEQLAARYRVRLDGEEKQFALHLELESASGLREELASTGAAGLPFSTADRDNDLAADVNCAQLLSGGWWFAGCGGSNLNGRFPRRPSLLRRQQLRRQAMFWTSAGGHDYSPKTSVLKIAPADMTR